jgi:hypothetical protein
VLACEDCCVPHACGGGREEGEDVSLAGRPRDIGGGSVKVAVGKLKENSLVSGAICFEMGGMNTGGGCLLNTGPGGGTKLEPEVRVGGGELGGVVETLSSAADED